MVVNISPRIDRAELPVQRNKMLKGCVIEILFRLIHQVVKHKEHQSRKDDSPYSVAVSYIQAIAALFHEDHIRF